MHRLILSVFEDLYGPWQDDEAIQVKATCSHSKLLRLADDMEASTAWRFLADQRQKWA